MIWSSASNGTSKHALFCLCSVVATIHSLAVFDLYCTWPVTFYAQFIQVLHVQQCAHGVPWSLLLVVGSLTDLSTSDVMVFCEHLLR